MLNYQRVCGMLVTVVELSFSTGDFSITAQVALFCAARYCFEFLSLGIAPRGFATGSQLIMIVMICDVWVKVKYYHFWLNIPAYSMFNLRYLILGCS